MIPPKWAVVEEHRSLHSLYTIFAVKNDGIFEFYNPLWKIVVFRTPIRLEAATVARTRKFVDFS